MTTYKVVFINNNTHNVGVDCFTAGSEWEARHDFSECYRHGDYTVFAVVPVPEKDNQSVIGQEEKSEKATGNSVSEEIDKTITAVAKRIRDDSAPGEYANTVKALAALVEARASLKGKGK